MKKFYSIIALASLMLTSVLSLTSCQKDEMPSTIAKTQTAQVSQQSTQPVTTTSTGTTADGEKMTVTTTTSTDGSQTHVTTLIHYEEELKVPDTSYTLGTWKATVNGTDYTLVVTNDTIDNSERFTDYKATLYVGDKAYTGRYAAQHNIYQGQFGSKEKANANGAYNRPVYLLYFTKFDESNLNEFKTTIYNLDQPIAQDVTFVKQ